MKKFFLLISVIISVTASAQFTYISPMPGSKNHNPETNIILKAVGLVDESSLSSGNVTIFGSLSGEHKCNIILSDDRKTILLYPVNPFMENETVTVHVADEFKLQNGNNISGTSFQFTTHPHRTPQQLADFKEAIRQKNFEDGFDFSGSTLRTDSCAGLPSYEIMTNDSEAFKGDVFYYNYQMSILPNDNWYRTIITSEGDTVYYDCNDKIGVGWTVAYDGRLTCYHIETSDNCFDVFDSSYNFVQAYCAGNGFFADAHEFKLYPGGHGFVTCDDPQFVDLTAYGSWYDSSVVIGAVIQELDANDNVVFQWRSFDHFMITDALPSYPLTSYTVDPVHINSLDLDTDNNLLALCRHMNEITKIDLTTGDIIWRWGGENNQFTFINDDPSPYFGQPHDIRCLKNGNFSFFNNAYQISALRASAKVYHLDQANLTATLRFKYEHPDINGTHIHPSGLGSVQLLPNGHYFICWGNTYPPSPEFTEVDTNMNIHWEMRFTGPENYYCYRGFKFNWSSGIANAIESSANDGGDLFQIIPNPIHDDWAIQYFSKANTIVEAKITDLCGSLIGRQEFQVRKGKNLLDPVFNFFSQGLYLVTISDGTSIRTEKIIVLK